ncbi:MAG: hypothetical protein ACSNEK_00210 [Parachlamydiaceae bacterium]
MPAFDSNGVSNKVSHNPVHSNPTHANVNLSFTEKSKLFGFRKFVFAENITLNNTSDRQIAKLQAEHRLGFYDPTTSTFKADQRFIDLMEKKKIDKIVYRESNGQKFQFSRKNIQALNGQEAKELSRAVNDFMEAYAQLRMNEAAALKERNNHEKESSFEDKDHEIPNNAILYQERRSPVDSKKATNHDKIFLPAPSEQAKLDRASDEHANEKRHSDTEFSEEVEKKHEKEKSAQKAFEQMRERVLDEVVKRSFKV